MRAEPSPVTVGAPDAAVQLIAGAGLNGPYHLFPLTGGGNNRVFRIEARGSQALLKAYFQHPQDPRDRLATEFAFSRFAWDNGVRSLPRPLAADPINHLGLYEFIPGRRPQENEITATAVRQALEFYRLVNCQKHLPTAQALPNASEACFTLADHLLCVERRIRKLREMEEESPLRREAAAFVRGELSEAWLEVQVSVRNRAEQLGLAADKELTPQQRCLSPSDFGFHNSLLTADGRLWFIDFEYAGWDDPAKTVCDFFCQPAVPVPRVYFDLTAQSLIADLPYADRHWERIALLWPVYQLKWCCILLNDFLPAGSKRRGFATGIADSQEQKARQLHKARHVIENLAGRSL
jgi:hypothetical protein